LTATGVLGGGLTTFPYVTSCDHNTDITVADYTVIGQELSFTLYSDSPTPLKSACPQVIEKIEINTRE
jgi:hypothetical protein